MSKLDDFFAFKIGEYVRPRFHQPGFNGEGHQFVPQGMVIVERELKECYGGIQANYFCRIHSTLGEWGEKRYAFTEKLFPFTEPEIVALEPVELLKEKPQKTRS